MTRARWGLDGPVRVGHLRGGWVQDVKIRAEVDPSTSGSAVLSNTASLSSTRDPAPGNNSATAATDVDTAADLSMTKSDSPDPVLAGNIWPTRCGRERRPVGRGCVSSDTLPAS